MSENEIKKVMDEWREIIKAHPHLLEPFERLQVFLDKKEIRLNELEKNIRVLSQQVMELNQEIENVKMDFGSNQGR
ncbi:MAG: hypothetical protein ACKVQC_03520 [Elusimicrobiota bacterium]